MFWSWWVEHRTAQGWIIISRKPQLHILRREYSSHHYYSHRLDWRGARHEYWQQVIKWLWVSSPFAHNKTLSTVCILMLPATHSKLSENYKTSSVWLMSDWRRNPLLPTNAWRSTMVEVTVMQKLLHEPLLLLLLVHHHPSFHFATATTTTTITRTASTLRTTTTTTRGAAAASSTGTRF